MAGIGFELKKLFEKKGLIAKFKAYSYSGVVCVGPMFLGFILILSIYILTNMAKINKAENELMVCMITYTIIASVFVSGISSMVVTRYVSDMLFEEKNERVMPALWGSSCVLMVIGSLLYGGFIFSSSILFVYKILVITFFNVLILVWNEMNFLSAIKDYKSIMKIFVISVSISIISCVLLIFVIKLDVVCSALISLIVAYGIMAIWYMVLLLRYFPKGEGSSFLFLEWFDRFPQLAGMGICMNIGLFGHQILAWHGNMGQRVFDCFYSSAVYDISVLFSFLVIFVTQIVFVASVEVKFVSKYKEYFRVQTHGGRYSDVEKAESELKVTLVNQLSYLFIVQLIVTILFVTFGNELITKLPVGVSSHNLGVYRALCLGYSFYILGNCILLLLLYFADNKGAFVCSAIYAFVSFTGALLTKGNDMLYAGYGFMIGGFVLVVCALIRLCFFLKNIEYRVLGCQEVVHREKKGFFGKILASRKDEKRNGIS